MNADPRVMEYYRSVLTREESHRFVRERILPQFSLDTSVCSSTPSTRRSRPASRLDGPSLPLLGPWFPLRLGTPTASLDTNTSTYGSSASQYRNGVDGPPSA